MGQQTFQRKSIHTFDCIMICSILALSVPKKIIKKISYRYGLTPKQKRFDHWYGFYQLHQHAHNADSPVSGALDDLLNRQHACHVRELENIDSTDVPALKSFIDKGMSTSPGGTVWALLSDPRQELQSQGVYYAHKLIYNHLNGTASGTARHNDLPKNTDSSDRINMLCRENTALRKELNEQRAGMEKTEREQKQLLEERNRLKERIAELERRSPRECRLLRENRMLKYRLDMLDAVNREDKSEETIVECTHVFSIEENSTDAMPSHPACENDGICPLDAMKVAVVGGLDRMEERYRKTVERLGGTFVFHNGYCNNGTHVLKNMVCGSDIVVFITSVNSHNAMWTVKAECRKSGKKFTVLKQTSPHALEKKLLAEVAG